MQSLRYPPLGPMLGTRSQAQEREAAEGEEGQEALMPLHPAYVYLTGATRLRPGLFGKMVVQVDDTDGNWQDATERDLLAIGFEASSARGRQRTQRPARDCPPRDWNIGTDRRLAWE